MYNFDKPVNRRNTNAVKWNVAENELPMWIADMDFETAPEVKEALMKRVSHGVFGYTDLPKEWYKAYCHWWKTRHHYEMKEEGLIFCTGVLPILAGALKVLTEEGDQVVVQSPVYFRFFQIIQKLNRVAVENPLKYDGDAFSIDFADLEQKLAQPKTKVLFLCNPHNPVGRCWTREELEKIDALCQKYDVTVVGDEIHCDITDPGINYVPFASVSTHSERSCITCISPTKAFNLAGIHTAAAYVANSELKEKLEQQLHYDDVTEPNCFAVVSAIAAFEHGADWLDALREYIYQNKKYTEQFVQNHIPEIHVVSSESTYLLWLDCRELAIPADQLAALIRKKTGLFLSAGNAYGMHGDCFLRMNAACARSILEDGLARLKEGIQSASQLQNTEK